MRNVFIYSFLLTLILSCKKKQAITIHEIISTPVSSKINKSFWLNANVGFICGGEKGSVGYIYKTIDGGVSWKNNYSVNKSLYDVLFVNDTLGYCCGENMIVLKTIDAGINWLSIAKANNSDNFYNGTLYSMMHLQNKVWFFGGKNFNIGFVICTQGNLMKDGFSGFSNEMRCGIPIDTNKYMACGYGLCYKTIDNSNSFSAYDLGNEYFTSYAYVNQNVGFLSGFNGGIYKINPETNETSQIFKLKKKLKKQFHFTGLYFTSETYGWVVGNDGAFAKTTDGNTFEVLYLNTTSNLLSVVSNKNNQIIISTENGQLIKVSN